MSDAYLRRERFYSGDNYEVRIGGAMSADDGLRVPMGTVTGAWWDIPLPPCPDCGGTLVWAEAGHVPGTRQCLACGSMFSVRTEQRDDDDHYREWIGQHADDGAGEMV